MAPSHYERERWRRYARPRWPGVVAALGSLIALGVAVVCFGIAIALSSDEPGLARPWFVASLIALATGVWLAGHAAVRLRPPR